MPHKEGEGNVPPGVDVGLDHEKMLDHASERLPLSDPGSSREAQVEAFRRFLKIENERLRFRHRLGMGGAETARGRSYLVDLVLCRVCQLAAAEIEPTPSELAQCSIVALGGYGRRELSPYSDVDLLFLHGGKPGKAVKKFVEQVLYLLWDSGLTVGHSYRSVGESLGMAREDLHSRTALSDARLVTGNEPLFKQLVRELDGAVYGNKKEAEVFFAAMRVELLARREKFGRAVCLQEPHVKEGAGGLRDLHTVLWSGLARYGCRGLDDLRTKDLITGGEYATARRAYDFLYRVRNEAHFATGRKSDLLSLDIQPTMAANLGYKPKRGVAPSEVFMREYYEHADALHGFCESFQLRVGGMEAPRRRFIFREKVDRRGMFEIRDGKMYPKAGASGFHPSAPRLMEAFGVAQSEGVALSDELKQALRTHARVIDRRYRASKEASRSFLALLGRPGRVGGTLRTMHATGLLGRLLPEFARIRFLVQHDSYHRFTIDEHTLTAIDALDELVGTEDAASVPFERVLKDVEDPAVLYLGMLLHDIGKGLLGGQHVAKGVRISERICRRLGLSEETRQGVIFLVEHHLLMSQVSQRRDLSDARLIESFAETCGTVDRLNMLLLLTYADHRGVGPGAWNDWKAALLWELYDGARRELTGRRGRREPDVEARAKQKVLDLAEGEIPGSEVERHLAMLPERYLRVTAAETVIRHLRLVRRLEGTSLVADWRVGGDRHCTEVTVSTTDRPGVFAEIAGTFTAHGINILSVDVYTREDGIVLDTFKLSDLGGYQPVRPERWDAIEASLRAALEGRLDVEDAVEKSRARAPKRPRRKAHRPVRPTVRFDSGASATATVVEVRAEDEPGLVYRIASTLASTEVDIHFAKIATDKSHALDVFYVTDSEGQKLLPPRMSEVEGRLLEALGGGRSTMKEKG